MPPAGLYSATTVDERDLFCDVVLVYLRQISEVFKPSLVHDRLKLRDISLIFQLDRLKEVYVRVLAFDNSILILDV